jgi:hypothetical protein
MREFSVSAGGQTVAGATTLVFVNPAAAVNPNLEFLRFWVGQSANATSAQQRIQLDTQASAFPTLTSSTPTKLKVADPNASVITGGTAGAAGTSGVNASAEGAGTKTPVWDDAFNVLNGWLHVPTPAETRVMPAGFAQGLGLFFPVAPATLTNWAFGLVFREI